MVQVYNRYYVKKSKNGIERTKIFWNRTNREDFVSRLAELAGNGHLIVYAWALLSNHYHILARTGWQPLAQSMRKLLTGYVVNFDKQQKMQPSFSKQVQVNSLRG